LTRERREFSAAELRFAMSLAEQVGVAISNGRMFKEMENQVRLFAAQRHIAKMVNSTLDLDQILASIVDTLPATLGVKGCTIRLLQPATNRLELVAASGLSRDYLDRGSIRREDSIFQALQGEPVAIYDAENDPRVEYHQAIRNEGIKSILAVPIKNDRDVIGVLRLLSATPRSFSAGDIHLTVTLAEEGGNAIEKARTYRQITLLFNQIEEQERFLQTILDSLSMQLVVVDSDKRIIMANSHFLSCHKAGESEVLGKPYDQVVSWKDPDGEACMVEQVFAEGRPLTKERRPASGERHWYEHSLVPVSNGETGVNFVMEAVRDITERHELEQEKLERTKLQGVVEMAGTAAHELNTPLFAALGTAELLYDDLGSEALRQEVETIIRNLQAMKSLTRQMTAVTGYEPREYVGNTTIVALTTSKEKDSTPIDNTQHEEKQ
ncbi:MAG TPA: GAF domain-containing protein, partial [Desulfopila sp.]|nr:GAF domain-containing protein [Desulfopila sp.]